MKLTENKIRALVKQLVRESFESLNETQKGKKIDAHIANFMSGLKFYMLDEKFNQAMIMKSIEKLLHVKINKVMMSHYDYADFFIVPLGDFEIKTNDSDTPVTFTMDRFEKNFSFPYLYIYHDTAIVLRFGSRFYDDDKALIEGAQAFLKANKINLDTLSEKNKIVIDKSFDTKNVIDMVDYSQIKRPEAPKKEPALAKDKGSYKVGQTIDHPVFGKGQILKTKSAGADKEGNTLYDVTLNFGGKEKTLRMKKVKKQTV